LAERYGVKPSLVRVRLDRLGWSLEEALTPKGRDRRVTHYVTYGGEKVPLPEFARRHGLDPAVLRQRLVRNGMSPDEALARGPVKDGKASDIRPLWKNMLNRCQNPRNPAYPNYGARGIGVDPRWLDFETFLADMGPRPGGYTLERLDNEKGYSPDNCEWATRRDQNRNKRRSRRVMFQGELVSLIGLAERYSQPPKLVQVRLDVLGWSLEEALTLKKGERSRRPRDT
jgi:phage shock protein PspC (stress-responsive transcriptional regulator)